MKDAISRRLTQILALAAITALSLSAFGDQPSSNGKDAQQPEAQDKTSVRWEIARHIDAQAHWQGGPPGEPRRSCAVQPTCTDLTQSQCNELMEKWKKVCHKK